MVSCYRSSGSISLPRKQSTGSLFVMPQLPQGEAASAAEEIKRTFRRGIGATKAVAKFKKATKKQPFSAATENAKQNGIKCTLAGDKKEGVKNDVMTESMTNKATEQQQQQQQQQPATTTPKVKGALMKSSPVQIITEEKSKPIKIEPVNGKTSQTPIKPNKLSEEKPAKITKPSSGVGLASALVQAGGLLAAPVQVNNSNSNNIPEKDKDNSNAILEKHVEKSDAKQKVEEGPGNARQEQDKDKGRSRFANDDRQVSKHCINEYEGENVNANRRNRGNNANDAVELAGAGASPRNNKKMLNVKEKLDDKIFSVKRALSPGLKRKATNDVDDKPKPKLELRTASTESTSDLDESPVIEEEVVTFSFPPRSALYGAVRLLTQLNHAVMKVEKGSKPVIHLCHDIRKAAETEKSRKKIPSPKIPPPKIPPRNKRLSRLERQEEVFIESDDEDEDNSYEIQNLDYAWMPPQKSVQRKCSKHSACHCYLFSLDTVGFYALTS